MQLNDKTVSRVFKFLLSIWEVSKVNALIQQRHYYQLIAQSLRSVQNTFCFLTNKTFSSCLWAFFCFLFFINSTFNLGPGVIACATGVFFFAFFRRAKASAACEQQTYFRSSLRRERSDDWKYVCRLQAKASVKSAWSAFPPRAFLALLARFALAFAGLKNTHTRK